MDIEIAIAGRSREAELRSLHDWLLREPALRDSRVTHPVSTPPPEEMGVLSDVLVVALGSGGAGAALAGSLSVWLQTRVTGFTVRIRTTAGEVEVQARNVQDPEILIKSITTILSSQGDEPS